MKLKTKRCIIGPFAEKDIDSFMAYRNNMQWMKYQGFKGLTKQEYEDVLLKEQSLENGMQIAVICIESDMLIGDVYLKQEGEDFWIGYTISPSSSRQGYAFEVVTSVIEVLKEKGFNFVKAGVASENTASIALLKKLNFSYTGEEDGELIFALHLI